MGDLFSLDITAHVGILAGSSWVVVVGGLSGVDFFCATSEQNRLLI